MLSNCCDGICKCLFLAYFEYLDASLVSENSIAVVEIRRTAPGLDAEERSVLRLPNTEGSEVGEIHSNALAQRIEQLHRA